MTPDPHAARDERLAERLARLEQQIRSFRELHVGEVGDLAKKLATLVELHADELQLVLDELADVTRELAARRTTEGRQGGDAAGASAGAQPGDPAAGSPKRAAWLAEEQRRARPAPVSRRELLFGREEDPGSERGAPERGAPGSE